MEDRYKLLISRRYTHLFDMSADPAERTDLSRALPDVTNRMHSELEEWKEGVMKDLKLVTR